MPITKRITAAVAAASIAASSLMPISAASAGDYGYGYGNRDHAADRYDGDYDRRFRGFEKFRHGDRDWRDREWRAEQERQAELAAREEHRRAEKREDKRERRKIAQGVAIGVGVLMLGAILSQAGNDHGGRRHRY